MPHKFRKDIYKLTANENVKNTFNYFLGLIIIILIIHNLSFAFLAKIVPLQTSLFKANVWYLKLSLTRTNKIPIPGMYDDVLNPSRTISENCFFSIDKNHHQFQGLAVMQLNKHKLL